MNEKYRAKIIYLVLEEKFKSKDLWKNQAQQREFIFNGLKLAKKDALIMHPGPMNRGVEIDTKLADDINVSLVKEQVELGVAVRMACLKLYCK